MAQKVWKRDDKNRIVYELKDPIEYGEQELITELNIREPVWGDLDGTDGIGDNAQLQLMVSRLSNQELPKIKKLSLRDVKGISEIIVFFTEGSQ